MVALAALLWWTMWWAVRNGIFCVPSIATCRVVCPVAGLANRSSSVPHSNIAALPSITMPTRPDEKPVMSELCDATLGFGPTLWSWTSERTKSRVSRLRVSHTITSP